jgi:hypothetical protein
VAPDLHQFGFRFQYQYDEILIAPELFDWQNESERQEQRYRKWLHQLPIACRAMAAPPMLPSMERPGPVPFSRLTVAAQMEVLAHPGESSFAVCAPLNPFLMNWRKLIQGGGLKPTAWPRQTERWLGGKAYAERFAKAADSARIQDESPDRKQKSQLEFVTSRLDLAHQYPILWTETP